MFERYTEKARRVIFFARYEASQYGQPYIESEHLLLGLLREDRALTNRFLRSDASVESIRKQIDGHTEVREKVSTSVDLPLSNECKRILAYAAEEAERLAHKHIGSEHLLLGILRENKCFAAEILSERGVRISAIREELQGNPHDDSARLVSGIGARAGGVMRVPVSFVLATGEVLLRCETHLPMAHIGESVSLAEPGADGRRYRIQDVTWRYHAPTPQPEEVEESQKKLKFIVGRMENAIANHEFEKARFYSDEERKERDNLRSLREKYHLTELPVSGSEQSQPLREIVITLIAEA